MPEVTADFLLWVKLLNKVKATPIWHARFRPIARLVAPVAQCRVSANPDSEKRQPDRPPSVCSRHLPFGS
jgi:hypothetical protein